MIQVKSRFNLDLTQTVVDPPFHDFSQIHKAQCFISPLCSRPAHLQLRGPALHASEHCPFCVFAIEPGLAYMCVANTSDAFRVSI